MQFFHKTPIQIRFSDIDLLRHVTNSMYQQYFDLGRLHYFVDVLQEVFDWQSEALILVSVSTDFMSQTRMHEQLEVHTKVVKLGNKSLEMQQQVYNLTTNSVAAQCKSVMVGYHVQKDISIPLLPRWREHFTQYEKDMDFGLQIG